MSRCDIVYLTRLAPEGVKREICLLMHLDVGIFALGICHCARSKSSRRKKKVEEAKDKHLLKEDIVDCQFGFWRTTDVTQLCTASIAPSIGSLNVEISKQNINFLHHVVAVRILHDLFRRICDYHRYLFSVGWIREGWCPSKRCVK